MIITVLSFKGGVGKSTIAQNLLVYFAKIGESSVLVDADTNRSSIYWYGVRKPDLPDSTVVGNEDPASIVKMAKDLQKNYKHVIIDCPPIKLPITTRALLLADLCVIPITPTGGSDIWTTQALFEHIAAMRDTYDQQVPMLVVFNKFQSRINLHNDYLVAIDDYREEFKFDLADFTINDRASFGYANAEGLGVIEMADKKAKHELETLAKHILENYG